MRIDGAIAVITVGARGFGHAVVLSPIDAGASIAIADLDVAASDEIVAQVADKMAPCSSRQRSVAFAPTNRHLLEAFDVIVSGPDFGSAPPAIDILLVPNLVTMILVTVFLTDGSPGCLRR